ARNPQPYYDFAAENNAKIVGVIETHPHADFVSSHHEIHKTVGAAIYVSEKVEADYPFQAFDEGDEIDLGEGIKLKALHTPGHSPDSISIVLSIRKRMKRYLPATHCLLETWDALISGKRLESYKPNVKS